MRRRRARAGRWGRTGAPSLTDLFADRGHLLLPQLCIYELKSAAMPSTTRTGGVHAPSPESADAKGAAKRAATAAKRKAAEIKAADAAAAESVRRAGNTAKKAAAEAAAAARAARAADLKPRAINKFVYAVLALVAATAATGCALKAAADARGRGLVPAMFAGTTGGARAAAGAGAAVESAVRASAARRAAPAQEVLGATVAAAVAAICEAPLPCGNAVAVCRGLCSEEAPPTRGCAARSLHSCYNDVPDTTSQI